MKWVPRLEGYKKLITVKQRSRRKEEEEERKPKIMKVSRKRKIRRRGR